MSRLECRSKPLNQGNQPTLARYEQFLAGVETVLLEIDARVIEVATDLRGRLNVKTPDAIHLASAIIAGATVFLTGDQALARCKDVAVEVM